MSKLSVKINRIKKKAVEVQTKWDMVKSMFRNSATIFIARTTATLGFVTTTVGAFDWSPLWAVFTTGTSFNRNQLIMIGVGVVGLGITTEIARRRSL